MIRPWYRVVLLVWVCAVLLGHTARAEEAQPLQPCVLVLPLRASPEMSGDQVFLGLAVQHVLENVLAVHSTLEECRVLKFRSRTLILLIIPAASKPGTMHPFHTDVRGALPWCHISFSTSSH